MHPKIEHDRLKPSLGEALRMPPFDPVHIGAGEQAVEQDNRPPLAHAMHGQFGSVEALDYLCSHFDPANSSIHSSCVSGCVSHCGTSSGSTTQR